MSPPRKSAPWQPVQWIPYRVLPRAICAESPGGRTWPGTKPPARRPPPRPVWAWVAVAGGGVAWAAIRLTAPILNPNSAAAAKLFVNLISKPHRHEWRKISYAVYASSEPKIMAIFQPGLRPDYDSVISSQASFPSFSSLTSGAGRDLSESMRRRTQAATTGRSGDWIGLPPRQ